jgi:hypothetical protein
MELFSCCVDFMILEADNLSAVFPDARLSVGAFHLTAKQVYVCAAAGCVLHRVNTPTKALRLVWSTGCLHISGRGRNGSG